MDRYDGKIPIRLASYKSAIMSMPKLMNDLIDITSDSEELKYARSLIDPFSDLC